MSITKNEYIQTQKNAEQMLDTLALYNVFEPPVPTGIIIKIVPYTKIHTLSLSKEIQGFSYSENGKSHILINDKYPDTVKRFTAFHELYHVLYSKVGFSKDTPQGKDEEAKAEYFAACMLMPASWFKRYWKKVQDVDKMAEIFSVSRTAVEIRLKNLDHYLRT